MEEKLPLKYESAIITMGDCVRWIQILARDQLDDYNEDSQISKSVNKPGYVARDQMIQFLAHQMEKELQRINYWEEP